MFFYQYNIEGLIERYQTDPDFFFFRNRGEGRIRGFEVESQLDLGWGLTGEIAAQIARGRLLDDDTFLDDAPADNVSVQLRKAIRRGFAQVRVGAYGEDVSVFEELEAALGRCIGEKRPACVNVMIERHAAPKYP